MRERELILVNGKVPSKKRIKTIYLQEGGAVRLQIINVSVERFYRLRLLKEGVSPPFNRQETYFGFDDAGLFGDCATDPLYCDEDIQPLYRVGGEGGLLDYVQVEGGITIHAPDSTLVYDAIIRTGEEVLGPADRTDVVIIAEDKCGNELRAGDVMYLWTVDFPHGRHVKPDGWDNLTEDERAKYNNGDGDSRNREIAARKLVKIVTVKNMPAAHTALVMVNFLVSAISVKVLHYVNILTSMIQPRVSKSYQLMT